MPLEGGGFRGGVGCPPPPPPKEIGAGPTLFRQSGDMCPSAMIGHLQRPTRVWHCNNLCNGGTSKWRKDLESEHKSYVMF